MNTISEPGRLSKLVWIDIGMDVDGLLAELEKVPGRVYNLRQKIAPLKAELAMLQARFESKGRSPSHYDISRSMLLSSLKEDIRAAYNRKPEFKEDAKGNKTRMPLTDGRAEDAAHASLLYKQLVEEADEQRRRIADLGREIGGYFDSIEAWRGKKEFLLAKLEQAKALTFAFSAEARLTPR